MATYKASFDSIGILTSLIWPLYIVTSPADGDNKVFFERLWRGLGDKFGKKIIS
jgi:hypothetical protein